MKLGVNPMEYTQNESYILNSLDRSIFLYSVRKKETAA